MAVAAAAAWVAARPTDPGGLFDAVLDVLPSGPTRDAIAIASQLGGDVGARHVVARVGNGSRVIAQDTVPFALWCARWHLDDYETALWTAVSTLGDCDTLGAIVGSIVALGGTTTGLFGRPEGWVGVLRDTADRVGDRSWPMPVFDDYAEQLKSDIADLKNVGGRPGGAITAALFLKAFAGALP